MGSGFDRVLRTITIFNISSRFKSRARALHNRGYNLNGILRTENSYEQLDIELANSNTRTRDVKQIE